MRNYKEKQCCYENCEIIFKPASGVQKYCENCRCAANKSCEEKRKNTIKYFICKKCLKNVKKEKNNRKFCNNCKEHAYKETEFKYKENNKENHSIYMKDYRVNNKEKIKITTKNYRIKNKIKTKENNLKFKQLNPNYFKEYNKIYIKKRREEDLLYKLKHYVSTYIRKILYQNKSSKQGESILNYLGYTIKQLKEHIDNYFKQLGNEWMNWSNRGTYNPKTWDDNDTSTWKWQLDHKIPHSKFKYTSMDCEEFRQCWSLENLRPLSAKQNLEEGNRR